MKIFIQQNAPNQGLIVKSKGNKNITVTKVTKDGVFPVYKSTREIISEKIQYFLNNKKARRIAIVTSATVLSALVTLFFVTRDTWEARLYKKYYKPLDNGSLVMFSNTAFSEAKKRYEQGDAMAAWLIMENLPDKYSIQKELILYKGLSLMDMNRFNEAIAHFDLLSELSNNKSFMVKTRWFRGLCYLKTKNINSAKDDFSSIKPLHPEEYKKAQKIIRRINNHTKNNK
jgi:tetratricopeptide (TPR) repeat protein